MFNSKLALVESALGDASLTEEDFAAIRTDLGNTAKALFPDQDTGTLHTTIERRVIGTRLKANLEQQRFAEARQELAGQEALLGEQAPVYAGALRRAEALALARQEEADKQATQAVQQAAVERAYQSLYGPQIAQDSGEAEALLASDETRARFGLDAQGAEQTLGLLRAYAAHTQVEQAKTRQQEEQQLLNTVLDLVQGTPGQAAGPVAACKAVQASGLDPQSKQQVLLALEQGRINTGDEPQSVNTLAEAIIRGEGRGTDTEMALTRAMAAGQLTHKSRERLTQLKAQLDGPYGSMLQHAYAGLAAQFAQNGSAAAQQQLAQQHLQAGFNQALTSNNFQELERLSHPDAVAAIAARYTQQPERQAPEHSINQPQTDYLDGFDPLEGPHLSAAQGGSRSDAGRANAPAKTALAGKPLEKVFILQKKREANWDDDAAGEQKNADKQVQELEDLCKKPNATREDKRNATIARVLHPLISQARAAKPHEVDSQAVYAALVNAMEAETTLSPEDRQFAMQALRANNGFLQNLRYLEKPFRKALFPQHKQTLLQELAEAKAEPERIFSTVDAFMEDIYKKAYGDPSNDNTWQLHVKNAEYYPERSRLIGEALSAYVAQALAQPEGAHAVYEKLRVHDPEVSYEAWRKPLLFPDGKPDRNGLPPERIAQVKKYTDKHGVPLMLALGVLSKESDNIEGAVSLDGKAIGLMQVRKTKFTDLKNRYPHVKNYRRENVEQNIELGVLALKDGLEHFDGDWAKAMAEYNIGEGAFKALGHEVPTSIVPKQTKDMTQEEKDAQAVYEYVNLVTRYCVERQPGFVLPQASVWAHLSPEKKKKVLEERQKTFKAQDK